MPNTREKLIELFYDNNVRCDQKIEGLVDDVMDIVAKGVTIPIRCEECRLHMNCPTEERFHNVKAESRYCCLGERKYNG